MTLTSTVSQLKESSHVFLGLLFFKTVENNIETPRQNALILGGAGHRVRLAGVGYTICKQQTWTRVFKSNISMLCDNIYTHGAQANSAFHPFGVGK